MKSTINYKAPGVEADKKAVADAKVYLGDTWAQLMYEMGRAAERGTAQAFQDINNALGFVGVQGYPVHALGRTYMLKAYREWMHGGDDPVMTDEKGFEIK